MLFGKDLYAPIPLGDFPAPALPSLSPQVFQAAFIHSSKNVDVPRSRFRFSEDFVDNERLEFLGDALLYAIVANYVYTTYPRVRVGFLTAIRQRLVQNITLAKFARMYKMDQALELAPEAEKLRSDTKTQADTFEAFVGAVAQVHGQEILTKWIEDLIRPYATQMYDHFARNFGEDGTAGPDLRPDESDSPAPKHKKRYRFCGFIPIPFLYTPETKSIAGPSSSSQPQSYGTLATVSQVQQGQYQRLPDSDAHGQASAPNMKKNKSYDAHTNASNKSHGAPVVGILKNSKSRERLAFTPPSVSNMEAAKRKKLSSLSDGEQPRNAAALASPRKQGKQPPHSILKNQSQAQAQPQTAPANQVAQPTARAQNPPVTGGALVNSITKGNEQPQPTAGWTTPVGEVAVKPDPAKDTEAAWKAAWDSVPTINVQRKFEQGVPTPAPSASAVPAPSGTPSKMILKRDDKVTAASLSSAVTTPSATNTPNAKVQLNSAHSTYLSAIQEARTNPLAVLERHPMFHGKKAKKLEYDHVGSSENKAVVRVKIDGKPITQGTAAGTDHAMAKQRGAFKAIEALMILPECPPELAASLGQAPKPEAPSTAAARPAPAETPSKPVSKPIVAPSTPAQLKKQAQIYATHTGPMPAAFYASFPTVGKESSETMRYYITSVKGFSSGTYHAILDSDLQLIGQSHNAKKLTALAEAEAQAREGKVLPGKLKTWGWEDRGNGVQKPVTLTMSKEKKEATGPAPVLTHALAVSENEKARLSWLEWYSEDKNLWKCAVLIDCVFYGSAKHAERKQAVTLASAKALQELESQQ